MRHKSSSLLMVATFSGLARSASASVGFFTNHETNSFSWTSGAHLERSQSYCTGERGCERKVM